MHFSWFTFTSSRFVSSSYFHSTYLLTFSMCSAFFTNPRPCLVCSDSTKNTGRGSGASWVTLAKYLTFLGLFPSFVQGGWMRWQTVYKTVLHNFSHPWTSAPLGCDFVTQPAPRTWLALFSEQLKVLKTYYQTSEPGLRKSRSLCPLPWGILILAQKEPQAGLPENESMHRRGPNGAHCHLPDQWVRPP